MNTICSFPPLIASEPKLLVLGTMPGAMSLAQNQYYAHKQNAFWRILFALFSQTQVPQAYPQRVELLLNHKLAVWDVLQQCEREGSLDSNIKNQVENDLLGLLAQHQSIEKICFNGQQAHKFFVRKFGLPTGYAYQILPSTSPAHTMAFEKKLEAWRDALVPLLA